MISQYSQIVPTGDVLLMQKLAEKLKGRSFLHINSTKAGGGVAEILHRMVPILAELGIDARWEVLEGDQRFYDITKKIHNTLQGNVETFTKNMWDHHYEINRSNSGKISLDADAVLIHDPQPAALIEFRGKGKWIWRCHIDISNPVKDT